jgi:hypothetical protein
MANKPKTSFELAMERLRAAEPAGTKASALSSQQKEKIAESRRIAASRLAECEILFRDSLKQIQDPTEREKAESEYAIDRKRIHDDCERSIDGIRGGRG